MVDFVALDLPVKETSVCVVDDAGRIEVALTQGKAVTITGTGFGRRGLTVDHRSLRFRDRLEQR